MDDISGGSGGRPESRSTDSEHGHLSYFEYNNFCFVSQSLDLDSLEIKFKLLINIKIVRIEKSMMLISNMDVLFFPEY